MDARQRRGWPGQARPRGELNGLAPAGEGAALDLEARGRAASCRLVDNLEIAARRRLHLAELGDDAALRRPRGPVQALRYIRCVRPVRQLGPVEPRRLVCRFGKLRRVASRRRFGRADRGAPRWCRAEGGAPRRSGIRPSRAVSLAAALPGFLLARLDVELAAVDFGAVEGADRLGCGLLGGDIGILVA